MQEVKFSLIVGYTVMDFSLATKIDIRPVSTYLFYNTLCFNVCNSR